MSAFLDCGRCGRPLPAPDANGVWHGKCPTCGARSEYAIFPRAYKVSLEGRRGEPSATEEAARCFLHSDNVAEAPCESCGRFVCGTCRVDHLGKVYCAPCLERALDEGVVAGGMQSLDRKDISALTFASLPLGIGVIAGLADYFADPIAPVMEDPLGNVFFVIGIAIAVAVSVGIFALPIAGVYFYQSRRGNGLTTRLQSTQASRTFVILVVLILLMFVAIPIAMGIGGAILASTPPEALK